MTLRKYNAAEVSITFFGIPIEGYGDGDFLTVERNEDSFTLSVGTDGEGTRAKSNNKSGRFTVTTAQSSSSNALLMAKQALDELSGDGVGPTQVKDNSGTSVFTAAKSWIVKPPACGYGRDGTATREWVIETDELIMAVGGN